MAEIIITLANGQQVAATAQNIAKNVREATKELSKAKIGTEEWNVANKKLEEAAKTQKDIQTQLKATVGASEMLKQAWNQLPGAGYFNQVVSSFNMMKQGVGGLVSQFGVLKTAIASTGIGLLVVVLGSLATWFTKTEEGADKLKEVIYPLQVLFQKLTGILADLGGKIFKRLAAAFNDPMQAIKDLGKALYDNVIARFEALGKFAPAIVKIFSGDMLEGFKDLGNASIQLATGLENVIDKAVEGVEAVGDVWNAASAEGKKLLDLENAIEDAEAALVVTRAKLNVEAAKAMELSKDITKSDEERVAAAKRFSQIVDMQTAAEENFLKLKQQRLILEQDIDGILNDEEKLARAQMEADLIQLQADNIDKKKKARASELTLTEEIAKREVTIATNTAQLKAQASEDGFNQEIAQVEQQTEEKIAALIGSETQIAEQKVLLLEIEKQQLQAVKDKWDAIQAAKDQAEKDAEKKRLEKSVADAAALEKQKADFEASMNSLRLDNTSTLIGGLGDLISQNIKDEKKARNVKKGFAVAEIGFNLVKELSANALTSAANPLNAVTFGAAGAAQLVALNIGSVIRAGLGIAKVALFRKGGYVTGPSHEQGGIPGIVKSTNQPIEFEGGEFFFSKRAVAAIGVDNLSMLNDQYTHKLAVGGPVNPFVNRAPISSPSRTVDQSSHNNDSSRMLESKMDVLIGVVNQWPTRLKVVNVVSETDEGIKTINKIRNDADV